MGGLCGSSPFRKPHANCDELRNLCSTKQILRIRVAAAMQNPWWLVALRQTAMIVVIEGVPSANGTWKTLVKLDL